MNETGGTVRVAGRIQFSYEVQSANCNVFTIEELVEQIQADPIGWFIDMYLGQPAGDGDTAEAFEKYEVISLRADPEPGYVLEQVEEITHRYDVEEEP